jgi:hypothetical protein
MRLWLKVPGASSSRRRSAGWLRSVRSSSVCVVVIPKAEARNGRSPRAATPEIKPDASPNTALHPRLDPG